MTTLNRVTPMENLDALLARIECLMQDGLYAQARKLAADKANELRACWGYDGKNTTEKTYIKSFSFLRAECCRRLAGICV